MAARHLASDGSERRRASLGSVLVAVAFIALGLGFAPSAWAAPTVALTGTVQADGGAPVPNVKLYLNPRSGVGGATQTTTSSAGAYRFDAAPGQYEIVAYGTDTVAGLPKVWFFQADVDLDADRALVLTLPATVTYTVRVLDAGGAPFPGVAVKVPDITGPANLGGSSAQYLQSRNLTGVTASDGTARFTVFRGSPIDNGSIAQVTPPTGSGYGKQIFTVPAIGGDTTTTVTPPGALALTGTLATSTGARVPNVKLLLNPRSGVGGADQTSTSAAGAFRFDAAPGAYEIVAYGTDTASGLPKVWFFEADIDLAGNRSVTLTLPAPVTYAVKVLDAQGGPFADVAVKLPDITGPADLGGAAAQYLQSRNLTGVTGSDGTARFTVFPGAPIDNGSIAQVTPPAGSGYGKQIFTVPAIGGDTATTVSPPGTLVLGGRLRSSDGTPVSGVRLFLNPRSGVGGADQTVTDAGGAYRFDAAPGAYEIVAYGTDTAAGVPKTWFFQADTDLAADRTVDVKLPATVLYTVRATGFDGSPMAGATVRLPDITGPADLGGASTQHLQSRNLTAVTDAAGEARFRVFPGAPIANGSIATITPPPGSGLAASVFTVPAIAGDTYQSYDLVGDRSTVTPGTTPALAPAALPAPFAAQAAQQAGLPPATDPVDGSSVTVSRVTGTVLVRLKPSAPALRLTGASTIPDGAEVDVRRGSVRIVAAEGRRKRYAAEVRAGQFVLRLRKAKGTRLRLSEQLSCAKTTRKARTAAAKKKKVKSRKLWVQDKGGKWETEGKYAATTVEGTTWTTTDTCTSTTVAVSEGTVIVRPLAAGKPSRRVKAPNRTTVTG